MAGTRLGGIKAAAIRIGINFEEYKSRFNSGQKWCSGCKRWHGRQKFANDASRSDGLSATCREHHNARNRKSYKPKPGLRFGPLPSLDWSGDKKEARAIVNRLVVKGELPNPNGIVCADCAHIGDDRRHEYDHHLGYEPRFYLAVEVVCSKCHHRRAAERGETWYSKGR